MDDLQLHWILVIATTALTVHHYCCCSAGYNEGDRLAALAADPDAQAAFVEVHQLHTSKLQLGLAICRWAQSPLPPLSAPIAVSVAASGDYAAELTRARELGRARALGIGPGQVTSRGDDTNGGGSDHGIVALQHYARAFGAEHDFVKDERASEGGGGGGNGGGGAGLGRAARLLVVTVPMLGIGYAWAIQYARVPVRLQRFRTHSNGSVLSHLHLLSCGGMQAYLEEMGMSDLMMSLVRS